MRPTALQAVMLPRDAAGVISGHAVPAHDGPDVMDRTGRRDADLAVQCGAPAPDAAHAPAPVIHQVFRDPLNGRVVFEGEARPVGPAQCLSWRRRVMQRRGAWKT